MTRWRQPGAATGISDGLLYLAIRAVYKFQSQRPKWPGLSSWRLGKQNKPPATIFRRAAPSDHFIEYTERASFLLGDCKGFGQGGLPCQEMVRARCFFSRPSLSYTNRLTPALSGGVSNGVPAVRRCCVLKSKKSLPFSFRLCIILRKLYDVGAPRVYQRFFRQKSDPWMKFGHSTEVEALFRIKNSPAFRIRTIKV